MKMYPLEIEPVHTDNEKIYRSKGHHSVEDFLFTLKEYGVDVTRFTVPELVYVKTTPAHKDSWCSAHYNIVDKSVRGCYPCTYVREYGSPKNYDIVIQKIEDLSVKEREERRSAKITISFEV